MLSWLRGNWPHLAAASLVVLYKILQFAFASAASPEMPAIYSGSDIGEYAAQSAPNYYAEITAITEILAVAAALLLAGVTYALWRATDSLATSTEDLAKGAAKQTAAMEKSTVLAIDQHQLATNSFGLQQIEFFTKYKPELEIRFAQRVRSNPYIPAGSKTMFVEFSVINTGDSPATITGSRIRLDWFNLDDVPNPDAMGGAERIDHDRLPVGDRRRCSLEVAVENTFEEGFAEVPDSRLDQAKLLLLGWIVYHDDRGSDVGNTRTTYFARAYDPDTQRFISIPELSEWEFIH